MTKRLNDRQKKHAYLKKASIWFSNSILVSKIIRAPE